MVCYGFHISKSTKVAFDILKVDTELDSTSVKIDYSVNYETHIKVLVTDLSDLEIRKLYYDINKTGDYTITWNKIDNNNNKAKPGYYFIEISSGDSILKMLFNID